MPPSYPPDLEAFVRQELERGNYANEDDLVFDALRLLRELKSHHQELCADIQRSVDAAGRGEVSRFDPEAFKKEATSHRAFVVVPNVGHLSDESLASLAKAASARWLQLAAAIVAEFRIVVVRLAAFRAFP